MKNIEKIAKEILAAGNEYVIWGVPKNENSETLLMEKFEGKYITDLNMAKKLKETLETKYECKRVRIQTVNLTGEYDWMKAIDLKK